MTYLFDVSPSGPGVLHPSPLTVFPSSHASDPNRSPSPGPDQILVQKWTTLVTKSLCFLAISMRLFQLERSTFGPDRFWPKDHKTASIKRETKRPSKRRGQIREHLIAKQISVPFLIIHPKINQFNLRAFIFE